MRTGILDIGSNSVRLSIVEVRPDGAYYVVDEQKATPRLAARLSEATGELDEGGLAELIGVLRQLTDICHAYGVERTVAIGTAALRAATNRSAVVEAVRRAVGIGIEVISGEEEARLDFEAVRHTLDLGTAYLVDIGGASTEITLAVDGAAVASSTLPLGSVVLGRRWDDQEALANGLALDRAAAARLAEVAFLGSHPGAEVIGIGGTIRTLARVHQAERRYPLALTHNYTMSAEEVELTVRRLAATPLGQRKKTEGVSRDRGDLVVPGGALLLALMRRTRAARLRVSGRGVRDGLFYTRVLKGPLPLAPGPWPIVEESVGNVLVRFGGRLDHARQVTAIALGVFDALVLPGLVPSSLRRVQYVAAMLCRIGVQVNYYGFDRHTFYLVLNSPVYGLTHRETVMAALAASFKGRGELRRMALPLRSLLTEEDDMHAARLGVVTRLAQALDRRHEGRVESVSIRAGPGELNLVLTAARDVEVEVSEARDLAPQIRKVFGRDLNVVVRA